MTDENDLYATATRLARTAGRTAPADSDASFIDLARALSELNEADKAGFQRCVEESGIGRRRAFCLVAVHRTFGRLPVPRERLESIGWTKLHALIGVVDDENYEQWLSRAEALSLRTLDRLVRNERPEQQKRLIQFRLEPADHERLTAALVENGAIARGNGLDGKEEALMRLVRQWTMVRPSKRARESSE